MRFKDGIKEKNVIIKDGADMFLPFGLTLGAYVILFGNISPGGGFQGGVLVASAVLILYLGYGYDTVKGALNLEFMRVLEAFSLVMYVTFGLVGIFAGLNFAFNYFFHHGAIGDLLSAETAVFMDYAVAVNVLTGVGVLLMLMLGMLTIDNPDDDPSLVAVNAKAENAIEEKTTISGMTEEAKTPEAVPVQEGKEGES